MNKLILSAACFCLPFLLHGQSITVYGLMFEPDAPGASTGHELFVQINPLTAGYVVVDTLPGVAGVAAATSTFDQVNREYLFWGLDQAHTRRLYQVDAPAGQIVGDEVFPLSPIELEFDMNSGSLYGLTGNGTTTSLVEILPDSASVQSVVTSLGVEYVLGGSSTFDATTGTYYFIGIQTGLPQRLYGIRVDNGTLMSQPVAPEGIIELQYDQQEDRIYALWQQASTETFFLKEINPFSGAHSNVMAIPGMTGGDAGIIFGSSVLDQASGTYVFMAKDSTGTTRMYALDARSGLLLANSPVSGPAFTELEIDNVAFANARYGRTTSLLPASSLELRLAPNPTSGDFSLTRTAASATARVRISDLQGRLVDAYTWNSGEPVLEGSLRGHPAGTYLIEVLEGDRHWTGRLALQ